jgi:hypothetical protein
VVLPAAVGGASAAGVAVVSSRSTAWSQPEETGMKRVEDVVPEEREFAAAAAGERGDGYASFTRLLLLAREEEEKDRPVSDFLQVEAVPLEQCRGALPPSAFLFGEADSLSRQNFPPFLPLPPPPKTPSTPPRSPLSLPSSGSTKLYCGYRSNGRCSRTCSPDEIVLLSSDSFSGRKTVLSLPATPSRPAGVSISEPAVWKERSDQNVHRKFSSSPQGKHGRKIVSSSPPSPLHRPPSKLNIKHPHAMILTPARKPYRPLPRRRRRDRRESERGDGEDVSDTVGEKRGEGQCRL